MKQLVYTAGNCPVACLDSGAVLLLKTLGVPTPFVFFCPMCGVASSDRGLAGPLRALKELAPHGVQLPTQTEAATIEPPLSEGSDYWLSFLLRELTDEGVSLITTQP